MNTEEILSGLSAEQREELLKSLNAQKHQEELDKRQAYEDLREMFARNVREKVSALSAQAKKFRDWLAEESEAFKEVMTEYGKLRTQDQRGFTLVVDDFKFEMKSQQVKGFDERSEMAARRLMDFLASYMEASEKGKDDPVYQLCMNLLERNRNGKFNYTSISKLYQLEGKFNNDEYTSIMDLFRESNVSKETVVSYYFWQKDPDGIWRKIEPSFCRL
jgi:DNA-binding transcriptional ArsR family regulator